MEGVGDRGNELEWETDFMPLGGGEGGMLVVVGMGFSTRRVYNLRLRFGWKD